MIEEIVRSQAPNKEPMATPPPIDTAEQPLQSYRNSIVWADDPTCPDCHYTNHTVGHLYRCPSSHPWSGGQSLPMLINNYNMNYELVSCHTPVLSRRFKNREKLRGLLAKFSLWVSTLKVVSLLDEATRI